MRIAVLGTGGWGTALALLAFWQGHETVLWARSPERVAEISRMRENQPYLPGIVLPAAIEVTSDPGKALADAAMVLAAVPTQRLRPIVRMAAPLMPGETVVVSASKGIERGSLHLPSSIWEEVCKQPVVALSGPNHAEEVARGLPAASVVAGDPGMSCRVQSALSTHSFRLYTNPDRLGVELGGSLKNVMALAVGVAEGLGLGDNAKAALLTRGLAEMRRLGEAMGATAATFSGLAGLGDLFVTAASSHSRNRRTGMAIGRGQRLSTILSESPMVVEGVSTTEAARELARRYAVPMPITEQLYQVLFLNKPPREAVDDLLNRDLTSEWDGPA